MLQIQALILPAIMCNLLVFCSASTADAQAQTQSHTIFKCSGSGGRPIYQSQPCAGQQRTLAKIAYSVAAPDPALSAHSKAIQQEMDRRNAPPARSSVARYSSQRRGKSNASPCEAAKSKRERELKRVGLKRNFDLLSRLDGEVWEACKGF